MAILVVSVQLPQVDLLYALVYIVLLAVDIVEIAMIEIER